MKKIIDFQQSQKGNYALIETDMQHGIFGKHTSGRKRLSIIKTTDNAQELLQRQRIVGGRGIEVLKTTWANFDPNSRFANAMYERTLESMQAVFSALHDVKASRSTVIDASLSCAPIRPLRWARSI